MRSTSTPRMRIELSSTNPESVEPGRKAVFLVELYPMQQNPFCVVVSQGSSKR